MNNYYELLGIQQNASRSDIKKAFREKAKRLHPDIAGATRAEEMRKLLTAYEILSNPERRFEYDKAYSRFCKKCGFDYRTWLNERGDLQSQAKLIFFELLHLNEDEAISIWRKNGGLDFSFEKYLDREDWLDCQYILAEELDKRGFSFEAFKLMTGVLAEERRRPYFKLFTEEIEDYIRAMIKPRLKKQVNNVTWIECMETMLTLGFPAHDEKRFRKFIEEANDKIKK